MTAEGLLPKFRALFPEFNSTPDAQVLMYLQLAISIFAKCEDATLWLAAFLLNEDLQPGGGGGGSSGQVTKMQVDSKLVEFAQVKAGTGSPSDDQYMVNRYGRMYIRLKNACLANVLIGGVYGHKC